MLPSLQRQHQTPYQNARGDDLSSFFLQRSMPVVCILDMKIFDTWLSRNMTSHNHPPGADRGSYIHLHLSTYWCALLPCTVERKKEWWGFIRKDRETYLFRNDFEPVMMFDTLEDLWSWYSLPSNNDSHRDKILSCKAAVCIVQYISTLGLRRHSTTDMC